MLADTTKTISRDYGVLLEEAGVALRGMFIIDANQTIRQITVNDLPVGRSAAEALRLVNAFQFVRIHTHARLRYIFFFAPLMLQPGTQAPIWQSY